MKHDYNSNKNQAIKSKFVEREIIHCASYMISELAKNAKFCDSENLYDIMSQDDWETPIDWHIENEMTQQETVDYIEENYPDYETDITDTGDTHLLMKCLEHYEDYQEFAQEYDIEPQQVEAYEHWIISNYLKDKLAEKGEMVGNVLGFDIWGRTCSGQAILLDGVISAICEDMQILEGQENEWKVD